MSEAGAEAAEAFAERVREASRRHFQAAFEEAGIAGLCIEGRIEYALEAVRRLKVAELLAPEPGAPR